MDTVMQACPDSATLERYRTACLDEAQIRSVEEHLRLCTTCQHTIQRLRDPASTIGDDSTGSPLSTSQLHDRRSRGPNPEIPGYELLGELGRGGMGVVYRARHLRLNRQVALKMILAGGHAGEAELTRFRNEAEALARLNHPHIVQVFEVDEQEGVPYFSLEFCGGGSLAQKISGTPLTPVEASRLVEVLARGIHAAHQKGVVHRDLKPANVLLMEDGTPKITDFGLAKKLDDASAQTQSGVIVGTPSYMAPEQASGKTRHIGPSVDIYALGAILYELLTGRPPFKAATPLDTVMQVIHDEPAPPSQLQSKTPRDLETICLKCLQKEPEKRYPTAEALADDLNRYLTGRPITARLVGWPTRVLKWIRRNPFQAAALALLSVSLVMLAAWHDQTQRAALKEQEANEATVRRLKAERDRRLDAAEAAIASALRRGDPRGGLEVLQQAEKEGLVITPTMRLAEADALEATGFAPLARNRLESFGAEFDPDLAPRRDLRLGDLLLGLDDNRAEELIRGAKDSKRLRPEEQAYADGVLTETMPEAILHFRQALSIDPYYLPARRALAFCYIASGRLDEAIRTCEDGLLLYPEHPDFMRLSLLGYGFKGDVENTQLALKRVKPGLREEFHPILDKMAQDLPQLAKQMLAASYGDPLPLIAGKDPALDLKNWSQISSLLTDADVGRPGKDAQIMPGRFPPPCRRAMALFWSIIETPLRGRDPYVEISLDDARTRQLAADVQRNPEGFVAFGYGMVLLCRANRYTQLHPKDRDGQRARLAEAAAAFERAADIPGILDVRQLALEGAVLCYIVAGKPNWKGAVPEEKWIRKAGELTRKRLALGTEVHLVKVRELTIAARHDGDLVTARRLLESWEKRQPRFPQALKLRSQVEFDAQAFHPALQAAEQALESLPKDAELIRIKAECLKRIQR